MDSRRPAQPDTDPTVPASGNPEGGAGHYSGQEADSTDQPAIESVDAGALRGGTAADRTESPGAGQDAEDLPPEAGHRATVDGRTGAVHGSGAGAGGGQAGEDLDSDSGGSNTE